MAIPCDKDQPFDDVVRCEAAHLFALAHKWNMTSLVAVLTSVTILTYLAASIGRILSTYLVSVVLLDPIIYQRKSFYKF